MASRARQILNGAREALSIARGEADPTTFRVHVPDDVDVKAIRTGLRMTQAAFAEAFGLSVRTVQEWERGRARPDTTGRAYLEAIRRRPDLVRQALAA